MTVYFLGERSKQQLNRELGNISEEGFNNTINNNNHIDYLEAGIAKLKRQATRDNSNFSDGFISRPPRTSTPNPSLPTFSALPTKITTERDHPSPNPLDEASPPNYSRPNP